MVGLLYAIAMIIVVVGVDLLFFRDHGWGRAHASTVGIVLVFAACYLRFLKPS